MLNPASRRRLVLPVLGVLSLPWVGASGQDAPKPGQAPVGAPAAGGEEFPSPPPVPVVTLGPTLRTHPIRRTPSGFQNLQTKKTQFNERWIDASVLPRDKKGIWVLDFAYRPLRILTIEDKEKGRRDVHYMYYQIINKTGEPRMFVPQFTLVTDTGKRYEDTVLPRAVDQVKLREDPTVAKLYGAVDVMGMVPPSTRQGVEDAVFGVAIWEGVDPRADKLTVFVRGLSDGYRMDPGASEADKPVTRYKALQVDFIRRGDEHALHEREITPADPPYDWTYR